MNETDTAWCDFTRSGDDGAFEELVRRYVDLVYATALRCCHGDTALAEDVTQVVFTDLAAKGRTLPSKVVLAGWLYRHTTFVSSNMIRTESRRRRRERLAMEIRELEQGEYLDWESVAPVLEEAMLDLSESDRTAVVLRFLDQQTFARVGELLGASENAARMRVDRALDRLRRALARRGVRSSVATLALALGQYTATAAPVGLSGAVIAAALPAIPIAVGGAATAGVAGIFHVMNTTKWVTGVAVLVTAGSATTAFLEHRGNQMLSSELTALRSELAVARDELATARGQSTNLDAERLRLEQQQVELMDLRNRASRLREAEEAANRLRNESDQLRASMAAGVPQEPGGDVAAEEKNMDEEAFRGLTLARMNYLKGWGIAMLLFAEENGGRFPQNLRDAAKFYPKEWASLMAAFDAERFEVMYSGPTDRITHPARTIIAREKEAFVEPSAVESDPKPKRTYLFADGHTEVHTAASGSFEAWERERLIDSANGE